MNTLSTRNTNLMTNACRFNEMELAQRLRDMKSGRGLDTNTFNSSLSRVSSGHIDGGKDHSKQTISTYIDPTPNDVLLGRGGLTNWHPGNQRFRLMVEAEKNKYKKLGGQKKLKNNYSREIMARVNQYGGRFLKRDVTGDEWIEAEPTAIRRKCSQALRERPLRAGNLIKKTTALSKKKKANK
mmetsp:Transcript_16804/g.24660  ORF Transcript_16804/g.24660 Transcript_16804/m.24660 type:complete len:183 (-) Transcript_16804:65-613(-)